jgi:hypothetical protein
MDGTDVGGWLAPLLCEICTNVADEGQIHFGCLGNVDMYFIHPGAGSHTGVSGQDIPHLVGVACDLPAGPSGNPSTFWSRVAANLAVGNAVG